MPEFDSDGNSFGSDTEGTTTAYYVHTEGERAVARRRNAGQVEDHLGVGEKKSRKINFLQSPPVYSVSQSRQLDRTGPDHTSFSADQVKQARISPGSILCCAKIEKKVEPQYSYFPSYDPYDFLSCNVPESSHQGTRPDIYAYTGDPFSCLDTSNDGTETPTDHDSLSQGHLSSPTQSTAINLPSTSSNGSSQGRKDSSTETGIRDFNGSETNERLGRMRSSIRRVASEPGRIDHSPKGQSKQRIGTVDGSEPAFEDFRMEQPDARRHGGDRIRLKVQSTNSISGKTTYGQNMTSRQTDPRLGDVPLETLTPHPTASVQETDSQIENPPLPQQTLLPQLDSDIMPLQLGYQHVWLRPCYILIFLGFATVIGSLVPALWRSYAENDIQGSFSLAQYILGVGVFVIGSITAIHSRHCTCWQGRHCFTALGSLNYKARRRYRFLW